MGSISTDKVKSIFTDRFGKQPLIIKSPGRINLIGEHTDYNDGFVLPAAIDKAVYIAIRKNDLGKIRLHSIEYNQDIEIDLTDVKPSKTHPWTNYILGVADQLTKRGHVITGFDLVISGDIPLGAGLSSSAAVECATAFALNELFDLKISKLDLVKISQLAEHEFAGVKCGIMDQFASMFGKKDHAIKLDCRSLEYEYVPVKLGDVDIVLFDTQVKHSLASTAYNKRREECEEALRLIQQTNPEVLSLRDCTPALVEASSTLTDPVLFKRAHYVVSEINRVVTGCSDLLNNNIHSFGQKMFASHEGLRNQYEVSCKELDFLVDQVKNNPNVPGARMMGGGFGGCTINLIKRLATNSVIDQVQHAYWNEFKVEMKAYPITIEAGTLAVSQLSIK